MAVCDRRNGELVRGAGAVASTGFIAGVKLVSHVMRVVRAQYRGRAATNSARDSHDPNDPVLLTIRGYRWRRAGIVERLSTLRDRRPGEPRAVNGIPIQMRAVGRVVHRAAEVSRAAIIAVVKIGVELLHNVVSITM